VRGQPQQAREALGARLREIRLDAGLTARALAQLAGWHFTKVSKLEHGTRRPSHDDIRAWCRHSQAEDQMADLLATARGRPQPRVIRPTSGNILEVHGKAFLRSSPAHVTGHTATEETRSLMDEHAARQPLPGFSGWDMWRRFAADCPVRHRNDATCPASAAGKQRTAELCRTLWENAPCSETGFRLTGGVGSGDNPLSQSKTFAAFPKRGTQAPGWAAGDVNSS
jgi:transcriptional regulator with XRE-family HTH domain